MAKTAINFAVKYPRLWQMPIAVTNVIGDPLITVWFRYSAGNTCIGTFQKQTGKYEKLLTIITMTARSQGPRTYIGSLSIERVFVLISLRVFVQKSQITGVHASTSFVRGFAQRCMYSPIISPVSSTSVARGGKWRDGFRVCRRPLLSDRSHFGRLLHSSGREERCPSIKTCTIHRILSQGRPRGVPSLISASAAAQYCRHLHPILHVGTWPIKLEYLSVARLRYILLRVFAMKKQFVDTRGRVAVAAVVDNFDCTAGGMQHSQSIRVGTIYNRKNNIDPVIYSCMNNK